MKSTHGRDSRRSYVCNKSNAVCSFTYTIPVYRQKPRIDAGVIESFGVQAGMKTPTVQWIRRHLLLVSLSSPTVQTISGGSAVVCVFQGRGNPFGTPVGEQGTRTCALIIHSILSNVLWLKQQRDTIDESS